MADERQEVAAELRRLREDVEAESVPAREPESVLGAPKPVSSASVPEMGEPGPAAPEGPVPPDTQGVNETWNLREALRRGGPLARLLERAARPVLDAHVAFSSRQVQFDNELLAFLIARMEGINLQYDGVLGVHGRHMQEIDERHLILQEELVAHVHDLVRRIDLTLSEAERTRVSLEAELRELRARVTALEARLAER